VSQRDTVVIGASAGGVPALRILLGDLPADLPARILVVLHVPASGVNALASILARSSRLKVRSAANQDRLEPGGVLVARPDHHLVVVDDSVLLTRGPRENGHRPSIDVLFRSAARALGPRIIAAVLSGSLDDGSAGLRVVRARGGLGIVQDPDDAEHPGMPLNAIQAADPEYVVPIAAMGALLTSLIGAEVPDPPPEDPELIQLLETEVSIAKLTMESLHEPHRLATSSGFSCPDCHGTLFSVGEDDFARFRCRVGHAWSIQSLLAEHRTAVEGALWMAFRALEEKAALCLEMSERAAAGRAPISARRFMDQATEAREAAGLVRDLLADGAETDIEFEKESGRLG
jgi:two-component system, chemotaxis family, protein-glutamate methylesterase/glutaminase